MSRERIFNVFIIFEDGIAIDYGIYHHQFDGSDAEKLLFLQATVETDFPQARRFPLGRSFSSGGWLAHQRQGIDLGLFEEAFAIFNAPRAPIICLTSFIDGVARPDVQSDLTPFQGGIVGRGQPGDMQDWLIKYTEGSTFRFDKLINDDYFVAIKMLLNAKHMASASKLLMSCVDTIAFIEHGDTKNNFVRWLDSYVDLTSVGISSTELWQFRNSVIHMTNLSSRAVLASRFSTIVPYYGSDKLADQAKQKTMKLFNFYKLFVSICDGISKWSETYNANRDKFASFIERYDTIISDSRLAEFSPSPD